MADATNLTTLATALRILAMDCVEHAGSGHPGMPMGMADVATVLWHKYLKHSPAQPSWPNRDRFVLSNGHGSALLYSLLHLTGYDLPIDQLKGFRRMGSHTPGHPEYGCTPGVETTTGPLGQGLANAVGMALAERLLAQEFNTSDQEIVDHRTFVFLGDGCLMEGISHEACSLAGTWRLNKLIAFWDDNGISIDGSVSGWFTDDTPQRFAAYGWNVIAGVDGHDLDAIDAAIAKALAHASGPTLICCKTTIGRGAPTKAGSADCHGSPLGQAEAQAVREGLGWKHAPFELPAHIQQQWNAVRQGHSAERQWREVIDQFSAQQPAKAVEFRRRMAGALPPELGAIARGAVNAASLARRRIASRQASQEAIETFAPALPELIGGSADLASSNLTNWGAARAVTASQRGNYLHYGVREFGM
ncbi:MAG TPA: thiamine pyrophosphate-dependent enzyme, partial [Rhizobacter sp.]|nr:thiamine pyrophosphate-dependent enzyme [Rhizobacter sp.]